jgi:nucleoside-diphosphate-sugar epimerase
VTWHAADLLDPTAADQLVERVNPTHLLHLAWCVTPGRFWTDPQNVAWVEASLRLARAFAAGHGTRLVAVGTCAEYAATDGACTEKATPIRPTTLYGTCKAAVGTVLGDWAGEVGVEVVWARLFHLFGPDEPTGRLVSDVIDALNANHPVSLSDGAQVRDYLHVDDAAGALVHLMTADLTGPVNVGSGVGRRVREVAELLGAASGRPDLLRFGARPGRPDDPAVVVADITRLRSSGWEPQRSLADALADTLHERGSR